MAVKSYIFETDFIDEKISIIETGDACSGDVSPPQRPDTSKIKRRHFNYNVIE